MEHWLDDLKNILKIAEEWGSEFVDLTKKWSILKNKENQDERNVQHLNDSQDTSSDTTYV